MRRPPAGKSRKPKALRGRPRDPEAQRRILGATLRLLREQGYARLSIDAVARPAAGVGKPTIYRRWSGKADLAEQLRLHEPPGTGTGFERVRGILRNFRRSLLRPYGMPPIGTVLAEEAHHPKLLRLFRERAAAPRRAMLCEAMEAARRQGEVACKCDIEAAVTT